MAPDNLETELASLSPAEIDALETELGLPAAGASGGSAKIDLAQFEGMGASRPSDKPILDDIAAGADYLTPGDDPFFQRGVEGLRQGIYKIADTGHGALDTLGLTPEMSGLGVLSPDVLHMALDVVKGLPDVSRGDVVRGMGAAAGGVAGGGVTPLGVTMAGAGSVMADRALREFEGAPDASLAEEIINFGSGMTGGFGGTSQLEKEALRDGIKTNAFNRAWDNLVMLFGPDKNESFDILANRPAQISNYVPDGRSIKTDLLELHSNYQFSFKSPETIVQQFARDLGSEAKPGALRDEIELMARTVDSQVPVVRINDPVPGVINPITKAPIVTSYFDSMQRRLNKFIDDRFGYLEDKGKVRDIGNRYIAAIKDALVPEQTKIDFDLATQEVGVYEGRVKQISTTIRKGGIAPGSKAQQNLQAKLSKAQSDLATAQQKKLTLQYEIENPKAGFEDMWKARVQVDAAGNWSSDDPAIKAKVANEIAQGIREVEEVRAMTAPTGAAFMSSKRHYELLKGLEPGVKRLAQNALDVTSGSLAKVQQLTNAIIRGDWRYLNNSLNFNTPKGIQQAKALKAIQSSIDSMGATGVRLREKSISALKETMQTSPNVIFTTALTRDAATYAADVNKFNDLGRAMLLENLKDQGVITPEEQKVGVDLQTAFQKNPQAVQIAQMQVQQQISATRDAMEFGDEEEQGMAFTNIVKMYPTLFPPPKSGIKGEIQWKGKRMLFDPNDRAKYSELIRRKLEAKEIKSRKASRIISKMNLSYEVTD